MDVHPLTKYGDVDVDFSEQGWKMLFSLCHGSIFLHVTNSEIRHHDPVNPNLLFFGSHPKIFFRIL
jgi:hypothetical protein